MTSTQQLVNQPFHVGPTDDRSGSWRVMAGSVQTAGVVSIGDARMPPHSPGPPRHVHTNEDEAIYVVAGVLTVEVGDHRYRAGPESLVWLPRQVPHVFGNLSDEPVWTVGVVVPGGLDHMFAEQADYLRRLHGPPDPEVFLEISARYGVFPVDGAPLS